jgi:hypothetical protein
MKKILVACAIGVGVLMGGVASAEEVPVPVDGGPTSAGSCPTELAWCQPVPEGQASTFEPEAPAPEVLVIVSEVPNPVVVVSEVPAASEETFRPVALFHLTLL